jgi:hypothetical protein
LDKLILIYKQLLSELKTAGVESIQVDEPILVLDSGAALEKEYIATYSQLAPISPKIVLTTYFARLDSNVNFIAKLPITGLHIDLDRAPDQLDQVLAAITSTDIILSLGLVSGRNIWKTDFTTAIKLGQTAIDALGPDRVIIATSCSLLHTPVTLASEKNLTEEQRGWFAFAIEKAEEVAVIAAALSGSQDVQIAAALKANRVSIARRREFEKNSDDAVRKRVAAITPDQLQRKSLFPVRKETQAKHLNLPKFPTTTLGSYPVRLKYDYMFRIIFAHFNNYSKPRRFVKPVPSSPRGRSLKNNTRSLSKKRSKPSSDSKRRSALTSSYTENLSVTTWFNTSANSSMDSFSPRMLGFRATVLGMRFLVRFSFSTSDRLLNLVMSVHLSSSLMSAVLDL